MRDVHLHHSPVRVALVRRPGSRLAEGLVTHIERRPVDRRPGPSPVGRLRRARSNRPGGRPSRSRPPTDCPDSVFVEDTLVVYRGLARRDPAGCARRGWPSSPGPRRRSARSGCRRRGSRRPGRSTAATCSAMDDTVYVGTGGRTNREGAAQLRALLEPLGASVLEVPVAGFLHLKSAVTALPDGTVVGYPPRLRTRRASTGSSPCPEASGAHVVVLGPRTVLRRGRLPEERRALRLARLRSGRRRDRRVPEARRLRDLPLGAQSKLSP